MTKLAEPPRSALLFAARCEAAERWRRHLRDLEGMPPTHRFSECCTLCTLCTGHHPKRGADHARARCYGCQRAWESNDRYQRAERAIDRLLHHHWDRGHCTACGITNAEEAQLGRRCVEVETGA